jgi:hypothetical protein
LQTRKPTTGSLRSRCHPRHGNPEAPSTIARSDPNLALRMADGARLGLSTDRDPPVPLTLSSSRVGFRAVAAAVRANLGPTIIGQPGPGGGFAATFDSPPPPDPTDALAFQNWLSAKPREWASVIAVRAAPRVLGSLGAPTGDESLPSAFRANFGSAVRLSLPQPHGACPLRGRLS